MRVALDLLEQKDVANVSIRQVAEGVGVNHRALYRHFENRDDLLLKVAEAGFDELADAISGANSAKDLIAAYVRFATARPALYDLMMSRGNDSFQPGEPLHQALRRVIVKVRQALGAAGKGEDAAIQRLWMLLHGGLSLRRNGVIKPMSEVAFIKVMMKFAEF